MDKISYTAMHQREGQRVSSTRIRFSNMLHSNAVSLFIAGILGSGLVVLIILATHRAVDIHPVQPRFFGIWQEPSPLETEPAVILERTYILCTSELSNRTCNLKWGEARGTEHNALQTALDIFGECVLIKLQLDVREQHQSNATTWRPTWNDSASCNRNKILSESRPTPLENLMVGHRSVSVYSIDETHLFYGTPFLTKWQELFNYAEDVLYRCARLLLVWRFGGIAYKVEEGPSRGKLQKFKNVIDKTNDDVIVAAKSSMVYSKGSCHTVIGSMLGIYAQLPHQNPHEENNITHRGELLKGLTYWDDPDDSSDSISTRTYQGW